MDEQLDDYGDLAELARSITLADTRLDEPPADLWNRIATAVAKADTAPPDRGTPAAGPVETLGTSASHAEVRPIGRRRSSRSRWTMTLGAVAAALVLIVGTVLVATRDTGSVGRQVASTVLVNDNLDPAGASSRGTATLVRTGDGEYALDVKADNLPSTDGAFLELWMIDTSVKGMISLGPVAGDVRVKLPPTIDPKAFPIVDISVQPLNGVATHSGVSILRGQITA
jgi:hypothetical protein